MTRVTRETVEHVAALARLSLTDAERDTFAEQLDGILAYAESIQALDLEGVSGTDEAAPPGDLRADEAAPGLTREAALSAAPDEADGLLRVPRVLGR